MRPAALRDAQSICDESGYRVTATAGFDGRGWELLGLEAGDTVKHDSPYGAGGSEYG